MASLDHIFGWAGKPGEVEAKRQFEANLSAAIVNYNPIAVQELIIERLTEGKKIANPYDFCRKIADDMNLLTGKDADPHALHDARPGTKGMRVLWEFLASVKPKETVENLLTNIRSLKLETT
ncbi:MAG TPA: hypothetical protein PK109_01915 [Candidatus Paceibacterota bacterium]|nr:hypothetical protein [Candidatus Paceibacterota bacterium]